MPGVAWNARPLAWTFPPETGRVWAKTHARSAQEIQATLGESLQKAASAAGTVEQQIATIADLGAKIKELLMEGAIGISE